MARVSTHKYGATMNKELLKKKCRKLIPLSSIPQCPAVLTFTPEELSIDVFSETKRGKDYLPIATTTITQTIDFSVNLSSFLEILGKVSSSDVIITFDDELRNYAIRDGVAWYIDLTRISR